MKPDRQQTQLDKTKADPLNGNRVNNVITLTEKKHEARIDSRMLADNLGITHEAILKTIDSHLDAFQAFNPVRFEIDVAKRKQGGGTPTRYALLNEDQAYLLLTFSRNTARVVSLKVELVKAFSRFRREQQTEADYLPYYHELHDSVKALSDLAHQCGSTTPERLFHININRLINDAFGLDSGQRGDLPGRLRVKVTAANVIAKELLEYAITHGYDHKAAYRHVKDGITAFANSGAGIKCIGMKR